MSYKFGDWVVYKSNYKSEIGRVTECYGRCAFVCYHQGCTASSTSLDKLRPATDAEIASAPAGIGYHRFDATCPSRDEECCRMCRAVKR